MANGDIAAAAGLAVFAGTQNIRLGYDNDNVRGDEIGAHMISGTHPASAITSGTLDETRIPTLTAAKIPNLDAAKITTGNITRPVVTASGVSCGSLNVSGDFIVYSNGDSVQRKITSLYTRTTAVTSSYTAVYADGSGNFGYVSSTKKTKQNIKNATVDIDALMAARLVNFRYKQAVKDLGENAAIELGFIAEEIAELGLTEFVIYDLEGNPQGIDYVKMAVALYAVVQNHEARISALEGKD